jgi:hypothetical protein
MILDAVRWPRKERCAGDGGGTRAVTRLLIGRCNARGQRAVFPGPARMAENFGQTPLLDGGYDGAKGFWIKAYGFSVCDNTRWCIIVIYLLCCCIGFYTWHVATTGSLMPTTKGSIVEKLAGATSSVPVSEKQPAPAPAPAPAPTRKAAGKRVASVKWSRGGTPAAGGDAADDDDEWVKMD